jgi:RNA recognition motif. (a.k.a. RRM, RBD, or RNP domain)
MEVVQGHIVGLTECLPAAASTVGTSVPPPSPFFPFESKDAALDSFARDNSIEEGSAEHTDAAADAGAGGADGDEHSVHSSVSSAADLPPKLFVGQVPKSMDELSLKPVFEAAGAVAQLMVIRDRTTKTHRGEAQVMLLSSKPFMSTSSVHVVRVRFAIGSESAAPSSAAQLHSVHGMSQQRMAIGSQLPAGIVVPYGQQLPQCGLLCQHQ